jgi:hypothetical protein
MIGDAIDDVGEVGARCRRCSQQIGSETITSYGLKYAIGASGRTEQSIPPQ